MNEELIQMPSDKGTGEIIVNQALDNFKSMFYFLKGKRDSDIKLFNGNKLITKNDICELNQQVQKKLSIIDTNASVVSATISLSNKEIKIYGNWAEFERTDWNLISAKTISVVIDWDFTVLFPNQSAHKIPQPHSMKVRIGSGLRPHEFWQVAMADGGEDYELEEASADMICKIDFVNDTLCNELKNIVANWYECLPSNSPKSKPVIIIRNNRGKIQLLFISIFISLGIYFLNIGFKSILPFFYPKDNITLSRIIFLSITGSIPFIYLFLITGQYYSKDILEKLIYQLNDFPMISLTKGDINRINQIKASNDTLVKKLAEKIFVSLAGSGIIIFFGDYITTLIEIALSYLTK